MKKTIIHIIDSLARGGAETLLIRVLKELPDYTNIVVTLNESNHFENELVCDKYICLQQPSLLSLPVAVTKFRSLVKSIKPDIVHSHLPYANFVARLGTPKHIPLITTIHTSIGSDMDYKKKYIRLLDKQTYRYRDSKIIGVSEIALQDYFKILKLKPENASVIHTFVDHNLFTDTTDVTPKDKFLLVSVGALRPGKNFKYLIEAFKKLKNKKIELHIYGAGPLFKSLQKEISDAGVNIILKGEVKNIHECIRDYDLFVMPSLIEGFSVSVLEAMASNVPLLLSDIQSFREQCANTAVYFDLNNTDDFIYKINDLISDKEKLQRLTQDAYLRMKNNFTLGIHVSRIKSVYEEATEKKTIVHIIDNLGRGGAETMLVSMLEDLDKKYRIILVTLTGLSDFADSKVICHKRYTLNYQGISDISSAVLKLKKIISKHRPVIIRSQLFWSTIIGRMATPVSIPFIFSVHSKLSLDAFKYNQMAYWLERLTYRKRHTIITVSATVLKDYETHIGVKGKQYVLNNFADPLFFTQQYDFTKKDISELKIVAVGNLKEVKNYDFLLKVIGKVKNKIKITLDIIGEGQLRERLQAIILKNDLPVKLIGKKDNLHELLPDYNLYIMCSHYEGFGNGPVEAMAVGLPLILNDLDTMMEMSKGNALFFKKDNLESLEKLLCDLPLQKEKLNQLSEEGKIISREFYTKEKYLSKLLEVYSGEIEDIKKINSHKEIS